MTRYDEIKAVDTDHKNFSSAHGITLGFPIDQPLPEGALDISLFIAMDPPKHDVQRRTVAPVVSTRNLAAMEALIRERTCEVLESLPEGETFNWVDKVSIELTTRMLATLFDFHEERAKLTRWSDVATAVPGGGVIDTEEQRREELIECLVYFTQIWEERKRNPTGDFVPMLAHGEETKDMEPMEFLHLILRSLGVRHYAQFNVRGVLALNQFPSEYEKLKKDPLFRNIWWPKLSAGRHPWLYARTANNDCTIGGKDIKAGDQILMWYLSATAMKMYLNVAKIS